MPNTARFTSAAVAALLFLASAGPRPAFGGCPSGTTTTTLTPSALALPRIALEGATFTLASPAGERQVGEPGVPLQSGLTFLGEIPAPVVETSLVTYRPRPGSTTETSSPAPSHSKSSDVRSVSQVNIGYFVPEGGLGTRFDLGVRGGPVIADALQIGVAADWMYRTETISQPITTGIGPGGVPITQTQELARATVNSFPIMAFAQLHIFNLLGLKPYVGGAAGYQVLLLSGEDFTTGQSFDGTFGGWGWQTWVGGSLPLGGSARLTGEAFYNDASLARDREDANTGQTIHETVNGEGKGLRFGVAWGF
jgi:hypothetical protein